MRGGGSCCHYLLWLLFSCADMQLPCGPEQRSGNIKSLQQSQSPLLMSVGLILKLTGEYVVCTPVELLQFIAGPTMGLVGAFVSAKKKFSRE